METFKESRRITLEEYCPTRKVPFDTREMLVQYVKHEDEINHATDAGLTTNIPKYVKEEVEQPNWVHNLLKGTLGQLLP